MGNTPSAQNSPSRHSNGPSPDHAHAKEQHQQQQQQQQQQPGAGGRRSMEDPSGSSRHASQPTAASSSSASSSSRQPNLRLPMPTRQHTSPQSSNPASPSGRPGSPRRRKSLELPDLNKLSFTPTAAPPVLSLDSSGHPGLPIKSKRPATTTSGTTQSGATEPLSSSIPVPGTGQKRWQQVLGGRTVSPLVGQNALSAMSRIDGSSGTSSSVPSPRTALHSASLPARTAREGAAAAAAAAAENPYFPSSQAQEHSQRTTFAGSAGLPASIPIPIPLGKVAERRVDVRPADGTMSTPPSRNDPSPAGRADTSSGLVDSGVASPEGDGLVNVPIQWVGGGKEVYLAGNFANKWNDRIKMKKSTHDFNTMLRLPPGQYKLKFVVDDSWLCSKQLPTATDDDGTLVNWIEVEAPKTDEQLKAEWALDVSPTKNDEQDDSQWTNQIPAPLVMYQYIEELPLVMSEAEFDAFMRSAPYLSRVPSPPALPRILDKVILNADTSKSRLRPEDQVSIAGAGASGVNNVAPPAGLDDNSILAVPNHVVLNHLTASAIKNGTLGVGTTTRYRKKYITTMFFKPTDSDKPPEQPPVDAQGEQQQPGAPAQAA